MLNLVLVDLEGVDNVQGTIFFLLDEGVSETEVAVEDIKPFAVFIAVIQLCDRGLKLMVVIMLERNKIGHTKLIVVGPEFKGGDTFPKEKG